MESLTTGSASNRAGIAVTKYLCLAIGLAALTATSAAPALAATHHHHRHDRTAVSLQSLHMYAGQSFNDDVPAGTPIDMRRAAAVHECSEAAAKFSNSSWQTAQFAAFGTCMTEHGQIP
jgi:hypothetical protein